MRKKTLLTTALIVLLAILIAAIAGCRGAVERVYDDQPGIGSSSGEDDGGGVTDPPKPDDGGGRGDNDGATTPTAPAKIGGTVIGLVGTGLVLENNGADDLTITAGGAFSFATPVAPNLPYAVTVRSQPTGPTQTCSVTNGSGTAQGTDVININVTCTTDAYAVGGSVVGLTGAGLTLNNNGGNDLNVTANGAFTFTTPVPSGANFNVTVKTQPTGPVQTCSVSGATGTVVTAPVTSVVVNCGTNTFTVGGTVSGLAGTLVLRNNGGDNRTITANGSFAFATPIASGANYSVSVLTQPTFPPSAQTCSIANGSGSIGSANITNVAVTCTTASFSVGGNVTGLNSAGLVLQMNGGSNKSIAASGPFSFTGIASGSPYNVTILTQPANDKCVVTAGAGSVTNANINNVSITCSPLTILSENFDGVTTPNLPAGWTTSVVIGAGGESPWQTSSFASDTAPNSVRARDYDHTTELILDSPPLAIASPTAQLSFWNSYQTEDSWDGGVLEISIAGAPFVDILAAGGAFVSGGYNDTLRTDSENPLIGRAAWVGSGTTTTVVNLPATAAGKSIVLRWRMGNDEGSGAPGWRIDTVVVKN